jgi:hypothetical protein
MVQNANITIYLQALGAHYLGAHAYLSNEISISLVYSGGKVDLPYPIIPNFTMDGNPSTSFVAGASSFMPITTVPNGTTQMNALVNFLSPDFTTACGKAIFKLGGTPEIAQLHISVPTPASKEPLLFQQPILLNPDQPVYSITVAIPGLFLSLGAISNAACSVYVKMMCGCPVTMGPPASLWPANDFNVYANILDTSGSITSYPLAYEDIKNTNSLFKVSFDPPLTSDIKSVTFNAIQKSTGNYGLLVVDNG